MVAEEGVGSRNAGIDPEDMGLVDLPHVRSLGRAVATVRALASGMGICFEEWSAERVALWTLDLTNAYRMVAAARHERWLQQFVWSEGVCLDTRCEFGTSHMVDLFERISTFVLEVAKRRIREYDGRHPYGQVKRAWQRWRREQGLSDSCSFADIYLDDGFGMTCAGEGEDCRGSVGSLVDVAVGLAFCGSGGSGASASIGGHYQAGDALGDCQGDVSRSGLGYRR